MADIKGPDLATIRKRRRLSINRSDTNNNEAEHNTALNDVSVDGLVPKYSY